ncbi:MAG TPA: L-threonylcarbamoyladenylate synthase [Solirubrobacteraceae bacterium]
MSTVLTVADARRLEECVAGGGVAVFPADTVYGLCCDPESPRAVNRLYELKGRPATRPAAVMFFTVLAALRALSPLAKRESAALAALLPGPITVLLANPHGRFPLACGPDPDTLGLRVPLLGDPLAALSVIERPVMQSSANLSGEPDARRLRDVPRELRDGADLTLDGGELPGVASTVVDLREYERTGTWTIVRDGAMERAAVERALAS